MSRPIVTGYDWAPDDGRGLVRDMRVRWALEEVGQPYRMRLMRWGEQKDPAHRTRNPFGQVPAFEDEDGVTLFESGAIVLHIADRHPGLLPADAAGRARALEWVFAALNTIEPPVWDWVMTAEIEKNESWSAARLPGVVKRLRERLGELAQRLGDGPWLDGDFSAGDLLTIHVLRNLDEEQLNAFPALAAYVARGEARPAFARALAAQGADRTGSPPAGWNEQGEKR